MRLIIRSSRLRALSQASALIVIAGFVSGCSSGASRLDELLTASVTTTDNQAAVIQPNGSYNQPYPGDVKSRDNLNARYDPQDTADRNEHYQSGPIAPPVTASALPAVSKLSNGVSVEKRPSVKPYSPPAPQVSHVAKPETSGGPIVLKPRNLNASPLKVMGDDHMSTGSIAEKRQTPDEPKIQTIEPVAEKPVGWKNTKGTRVTVKPGETLFNLSRRYGVPVSAIMSANNITDGNSVEAEREILIPTYNYSSTAPVSAPDNDPVTRASRASRGFQGQARGRVAVPQARVVKKQPVKQPEPIKQAESSRPVTGGLYTVVAGDTLYGIARRHGTTPDVIKSANDLTGETVKLGSTLVIPGRQVVAKLPDKSVDKTETGSIPRDSDKAESVQPVKEQYDQTASIQKRSTEKVDAPKKTASTAFRWPAKGRVITRFGERDVNGTNDGIDISVPVGTPIKASENGTVIYSGSELEDFGKLILVSHQGGWVTAYAHASAALVRRGDKVRRGQVIAKSGRTGNATVPKLHFELRKNSNPVNPLNHLAK